MKAVVKDAFEPSEMNAVIELEKKCFSDPWTERDFGTQPWKKLIAAYDGTGRLCGYAVIGIVSDEGEIQNLAVAPDVRRSGFGRLIMDTALGYMREAGVRAVFLEVRESNAPARSLYSSLGFEKIGIRPDYYSNPKEGAVMCMLLL